jgi:GT2 family glycosyltransferase
MQVWIWNLGEQHFPGAVRILDLYHARQHLWELARRLHPNDESRTQPIPRRQSPRMLSLISKIRAGSYAPRYSIGLTPQPNAPQAKQPPRVSVVAVSRNRAALLRRCLDSLEQSDARPTLQVIVVDNGSTDGSAQLESAFLTVQFVPLPKNFGLTKALNIGWRAADAAYVFFLHDDTEVEPPTVARLADVLDANPEAAAVCPLLVDAEGRPAAQLGHFPPDGNWRPAEPAGDDPFAVEYPRGAALMMRVSLIRAVRQIDERYGQFGSDADLAAQIHKASKKILLVPAARARHAGSQGYSSAERADFLLGRALFHEKYHGFGAGIRARLGSVLGPLVSFRLGVFRYTIAGQKIDGTQP